MMNLLAHMVVVGLQFGARLTLTAQGLQCTDDYLQLRAVVLVKKSENFRAMKYEVSETA